MRSVAAGGVAVQNLEQKELDRGDRRYTASTLTMFMAPHLLAEGSNGQTASQHPGSSSFLVRASWLSSISQVGLFAVRVLRSLPRVYSYQKWSIIIQSLMCMASSQGGQLYSQTMSPKVILLA